MRVHTLLVDMSVEECEELLASASLGRIGVVVDGQPEIFPVNHVVDDNAHCVVFPTNNRTKLHAALTWPYVSYEVDGQDNDGSGWSVLVVGHAEEVHDTDAIARWEQQRKVLWQPFGQPHWVRIVPHRVTGRRISTYNR